VLEVLPKRFGRYGLAIHPDKTRLVPFRSPAASGGGAPGPGSSPGTFDLLGFTHFWSRSRKGNWVVKRRTAADRLRRAIGKIATWCRFNRHKPIPDQHRTLGQKLRGHFAYYGINGNGGALHKFRDAVLSFWRKWLSRRSRGNILPWDRFSLLLKRYPLPAAWVVHSLCRP
jgi:hypothetical protein